MLLEYISEQAVVHFIGALKTHVLLLFFQTSK